MLTTVALALFIALLFVLLSQPPVWLAVRLLLVS